MATKQKTMSTSYCRNRNYSQHFEWTYELNHDVYKCHVNARNNPKVGYMKRMKEDWDNLHPEISHFNPKQLRQQATFAASKGIILDANLANAAPKPPSTPSQQPSTTVTKARIIVAARFQQNPKATSLAKKMEAILILISIKIYLPVSKTNFRNFTMNTLINL